MNLDKDLDKLEQLIAFDGFKEQLETLLTGLPQGARDTIERNRPGSRADLESLLKIGDKKRFTHTILVNPSLFRVLVSLGLCKPVIRKHKENLNKYYALFLELLSAKKIPDNGGKEKMAVTQILGYLG